MKNKGITLIALVITIVVLIILAAVAINLSLGNNGIFNRAKTAKEQYQNAQDYEDTEVKESSNSIDFLVEGEREISKLTKDQIEEYLNEKYKVYTFTVNKSGKGTSFYTYSDYFTIPDSEKYEYYFTTYTITAGGGFAENWEITPMYNGIYIVSTSASASGTVDVNVFYKLAD